MTNQNTPALRFKEFDNEWLTTKLNKLVDVYDGTHQTPNYTETGVKFLSVENIETLDSEKYISLEDFEKEFKIFPEQNDILMTRIGSIGVPNIIQTDEKLAYYVSLALLKNNGNVNSNFLKTYIESNPFQSELWKRTLHIAFPKKINKNEIANALVSAPLLPEQSAIGSLFQTLDELLSAYKDNLANYQAFKASMLSKMFPKAGQTTPEIRLDGFDGEWEEKMLEEGLSKIGDGIHGTPKYDDAGEYAFINGNNLVQGRIQLNTETKYVNLNQLTPHDLALEKNTILMSINGTIGSLGWYRNEKVMLSKSVAYLQVDSFDKNFIYYLLHTAQIRKYFFNNLTGTTIKNLGLKTIRNLKINYPVLSEQRAIGAFFFNFDNLISSYQEKIVQLEALKKKLLQDMFI